MFGRNSRNPISSEIVERGGRVSNGKVGVLASGYKSSRLVLVAIVAVAFLLRLYQLGESFWYDEILHSTRYSVADYAQLFLSIIKRPEADGSLISGLSYLCPSTLGQLWMLFFHWFLQGNSLWTVSPYANPLPFLRDNPLLLVAQIAAFAVFSHGL